MEVCHKWHGLVKQEKEVVIVFMYSLGHIDRQVVRPRKANEQKRNLYLLLYIYSRVVGRNYPGIVGG